MSCVKDNKGVKLLPASPPPKFPKEGTKEFFTVQMPKSTMVPIPGFVTLWGQVPSQVLAGNGILGDYLNPFFKLERVKE